MITVKKTNKKVGHVESYTTYISIFFIPIIKITHERIDKISAFKIYFLKIRILKLEQDDIKT